MQIILKRSRLREQPRLLQWTKKARVMTNGGFYPLGFTQETWDKTGNSPGVLSRFEPAWQGKKALCFVILHYFCIVVISWSLHFV